jgi:hypothetical protein
LHPGQERFYGVTELPEEVLWDDEGPAGEQSPYDEVGRRLVELLDTRRYAKPGNEYRVASRFLNEFLTEIDVRHGKGTRQKGPPPNLVAALFAEGKQLLSLCWDIFPFSISRRSEEVLRQALGDAGDDTPVEELCLWSARLALPVLSCPEILALKSQREEARSMGKQGWRPTPRRFAVWVLARRLRLDAKTLARKVLNAAESVQFDPQLRPNPVDQFVGQ